MDLPLHDFAQNQIWCALVMLAPELTRLDVAARPAQQRRPAMGTETARLRLFTIPAAMARTGRRVLLDLADKAVWAQLTYDALQRLRALAVPG